MPDSRFSISASPSSPSAEFTTAHRLLREDGFDHVMRAENMADKDFKIFFVRNDKRNARLGMVVAKKTLSGAADRNRVKRIIREAFRQHSIKQCKLDVVVMARRAYPQESGAQAGNLKMLFSRVENRCAEL
ncbi:MAG: ribonuclease P protein component [Gallionellaceae bacterium]